MAAYVRANMDLSRIVMRRHQRLSVSSAVNDENAMPRSLVEQTGHSSRQGTGKAEEEVVVKVDEL